MVYFQALQWNCYGPFDETHENLVNVVSNEVEIRTG